MTYLKTVWIGSTDGYGTISGDQLEAKLAMPESSGGTVEGSDPKELLASSAAACYTMTFTAMIASRGLKVIEFTMETRAMETENGIKIMHSPQVVLPKNAASKDIENIERMFVTADRGCFVGNLLKKGGAQIDVKGEISTE